MQANEREALRLLGVYTAGSFDVWDIAGQSKAKHRAHVMSALLDRRATQKDSGVGALRHLFDNLAGVKADTIAGRLDQFRAWARQQLAPPWPLSVGDAVTYTGKVGAMPAEFRGWDNFNGAKRAVIIVRPADASPFQCSVDPDEIAPAQAIAAV